MTCRSLLCLPMWLAGILCLLTGCDHQKEESAARTPPKVTVSKPIVDDKIIDFAEFTGRTEALQSVEIRARVNGYLDKIGFKPGDTVQKGDLLFEIDPRPYQAELQRAEGQVAEQQSKLDRLSRDYDRNRPLVNTGAISREQFDKIVGDRDEAAGALKAAKANVESFKLNVTFTKITAPISGKVSRNLISVGNLVIADKTLLTTIVADDQIYAYFDVDENALLRYEKLIREGKLKHSEECLLRLNNEKGYPHKGTIEFIDTQLNKSTGTIQARAVFPNEQQILKAGEFVEIRIPLGEPHRAILIPEEAVGSDQGQKFVYVVDGQNKAAYRKVKLGKVYDSLQVVDEGLNADEEIIVKGLQRVRDGATVDPQRETESRQTSRN